ncbi:DUF3618 domain-containing protein [Nonomuraea aurantiaca]|jgi:hypothetical protein|uniref:DUF3618 domain-containing protein n=1 Tax=Nonomuraea aurantiaca TaxID=2878562 RepID=UPI001CDA4CCA|nr:DUF3618 domain-containing protein [Nonomuraea aurantiaca]MCA2220615.1 DUF3618 domain-containing protein [Nonomuraea aurantiaca]
MSETDPEYGEQGYSEQHAGDVGARRTTVGMPTDHESVNVPPTRPGAAENATKAEAARQEHETFIPEPPLVDDRTEAAEAREGETESLRAESATDDDDEEEDDVHKNIKETRQELGDTVAALADKADVKGRANDAAEAAKGKATEVAGVAKDKAAVVAEVAKDKAAVVAEVAKDKAAVVAEVAKDKAAVVADVAKDKAAEVADKVRDVTPDQVKEAADKVTTEARKRPVLAIAAAGALVALVLRRIMRRNKSK